MKIGVVDDEEEVRVATESLLRSEGYETSGYASAEEFLLSHCARALDLIISDIQMPGMNGVEMQSRLRSSGSRTPVIFMTAFPEESIRRQAFAGGAAGFFSKPFDGDEMLACLANALHGGANPHTLGASSTR